MRNLLKLIIAMTAGLLVLFLLEGLFTLGKAFIFDKYSLFDWIIQLLFVTLALSFSAYLSITEDEL